MPYVGADNVPGRGISQLDSATNSSGPSPGLQAVMAYYKSKGVPQEKVTPDMIRQAIAANARAPGDPSANGPNLGPTVLNLRNAGIEDAMPMPMRGSGSGDPPTSAAPASAAPVPGQAPSDSAASAPMPPALPSGAAGTPQSSSLMQTLAPLLAGAGAASFPLGAYILDKVRGGAGPVTSPEPVLPPAPGPRITPTGPGFDPEYGPRLPGQAPTGPGFDPEYPARAPLPTEPTPVAPAPAAQTGPGFSPEYGQPTSPASEAITKATEPAATTQAPGTRGKGGRARGLGRTSVKLPIR